MWTRKPKTESDFWSRVNKNGPIVRADLGPCWLWTGCTDSHPTHPSGQVRIKNKLWRVTRYVWTLVFAAIPIGQRVCHKCDITLCVNPQHLFLGSPKDNTEDMIAKGRAHFHFRDGGN